MPRVYTEPEFMLTGWRNGDGSYTVAASDSLSVAEFAVRTIPLSLQDHRAYMDPPGIDLRVGMERLHFGMGASYQDAMTNLFQHWSPDGTPFALGAGPTELDAQRKELTP